MCLCICKEHLRAQKHKNPQVSHSVAKAGGASGSFNVAGPWLTQCFCACVHLQKGDFSIKEWNAGK